MSTDVLLTPEPRTSGTRAAKKPPYRPADASQAETAQPVDLRLPHADLRPLRRLHDLSDHRQLLVLVRRVERFRPRTPPGSGSRTTSGCFADPMFWSSMRITLVFMLHRGAVAGLRCLPPRDGAQLPEYAVGRVLPHRVLPARSSPRRRSSAWSCSSSSTRALGPIAVLFQKLGLPTIDFLGDSRYALPTVALVYVWKFFGVTMIYWLAALQTIPRDLYDAARIDGAGARSGLPVHHPADAACPSSSSSRC